MIVNSPKLLPSLDPDPLATLDAALRRLVKAQPEALEVVQGLSVWLNSICISMSKDAVDTGQPDLGILEGLDPHPTPTDVPLTELKPALRKELVGDAPTAAALAELQSKFTMPAVAGRTLVAASQVRADPVRVDPDACLHRYRSELSMQRAAVEWARARDQRGFDAVRAQYRQLCDRGRDEQSFMWALDLQVVNADSAKLEEIRAWYSVLCEAIDCYLSGEPELGKARATYELTRRFLGCLRQRLDWVGTLGLHDAALEGLAHWSRDARGRHAVSAADAQRLSQPDLQLTAEEARAELHELRRNASNRAEVKRTQKQAFGKFIYELKRWMDSPIEPAAHIRGMSKALDSLRDSGGKSTHREFVATVNQTLGMSNLPTEILESADGVALATALAALHEEEDDDGETQRGEVDNYSAEVLLVRSALKGKRMVIIGGDVRPNRKRAIERAFALSELDWVATRPHGSRDDILPAITRDDVCLVVLLIRWASHCYGEYSAVCAEHSKPFIRLRAGYSPNRIADDCIKQVGRQLGIA